MVEKLIKYSLLLFIVSACITKSKFDLFMERGLDVLDNTIEVNQLIGDINIESIGVIFNAENKERLLVLKIKNDSLENIPEMEITALKEILHKYHKKETWKFIPKFRNFENYNFLTYQLRTKIKNRVDTLYIKTSNSSDSLILNNLYLNNE